MLNRQVRIAIDGPAAAGKSTVAKMIADQLNITYIDTGAMYRALTLKALNENVNIDDEERLLKLLKNSRIHLKKEEEKQVVLLDDKDVTHKIRSNDVTNHVSQIAKHRLIREEMVERQRSLAKNGSVVMDGRDIGTHVIPDAEVKIYLVASAKERALRRHKENLEKGIESNLNDLKKEIEKRDKQDMNRQVAPLTKAKDAIEIDTTSKSIDSVVDLIIKRVKNMIK